MKTTAELKVALRNAHEAGDVEAAKRIAMHMICCPQDNWMQKR